MMTLTTRIALGLASFGFASLLGVSPAQAGGGHGQKTPEQRAERLCAKLACTAAQKAKIKEIKVASHTPQTKAARDNLRALKTQIRAERQKTSPDAAALARLEAQMTAQKAALKSQRQATQQRVLAVLNADQKAKYQAHLDARKDGKGKHGKAKHGKGKAKRAG